MDVAPALLAVSHGTSSDAGAEAVATLVEAVAARLAPAAGAGVPVEVHAGFVDVQQPDVPTCLTGLVGRATVVVPLLLSAGFHVHVDLRDDVDAALARGMDVTLGGALGPDDRLVDLLARRLDEAGLTDDDVVVLAAAGSSDPRAVADCEATAARLAERLRRDVPVGYIANADPRVHEVVGAARAAHPGRRVVVASYLLAPGFFADLAARAGGDVTTPALLVADDDAPAELVDVVLDRYRAAAQSRRRAAAQRVSS
ncbi:cobalamin biosynthesis protein CbiX [Isoptericola sp. NEAU-Y5]|uniref:Cobalamin biosynthesis protein CbiX n=1 Tax=Isoptericola luteus TaxID=2879484 RepID=A0ABS7ZBZ4_9MICO|nr:CbiX/SirB N-terminal domain-containing protein [Isoptericola sp. NEAU-Y5]MCA5892576.1 cobalamin biosynthesis protein CbiX [Isoptericola sp. NEAU-Y5]